MLSKIISFDSPEFIQSHIQDLSSLINANSANDNGLIDCLVARASLLNRTGKYSEALKDSEKALELSKEKNHPALYQKGISSFNLQQYEQALEAFNDILKDNSSSITFKDWKDKCEAALAKSKSSNGLSNENGSTNVQIKKKIKYDWYQSPTDVVITVLAKDTNPSTAKILITDSSLNVSLPDQDNFTIAIELFSSINVNASSYKISQAKVEIKLSKAIPHVSWPSLEKSKSSIPTIPSATAPQKLPSAYASKTPDKWNEIEKEAAKELEKEKPKGDEAFMELMKKIYKDADEDTRRAMNKSYQTSGGTVLSTNWGEVARKDYEKETKEDNNKTKTTGKS